MYLLEVLVSIPAPFTSKHKPPVRLECSRGAGGWRRGSATEMWLDVRRNNKTSLGIAQSKMRVLAFALGRARHGRVRISRFILRTAKIDSRYWEQKREVPRINILTAVSTPALPPAAIISYFP